MKQPDFVYILQTGLVVAIEVEITEKSNKNKYESYFRIHNDIDEFRYNKTEYYFISHNVKEKYENIYNSLIWEYEFKREQDEHGVFHYVSGKKIEMHEAFRSFLVEKADGSRIKIAKVDFNIFTIPESCKRLLSK